MAARGGNGKGIMTGPIRRGRGFRHAGEYARRPLTGAAARHGFAETDVLTRWPEIAGEALAALCRPVKVSYRERRMGATLVVEVEGSRAPEVEMSAPRILERVNAFYGYRAIGKLRVTQTAGRGLQGFAEGQAAFEGRASAGPSAEALRRAREMASDVHDPALRAALTRLSAYVLARNPEPSAD